MLRNNDKYLFFNKNDNKQKIMFKLEICILEINRRQAVFWKRKLQETVRII